MNYMDTYMILKALSVGGIENLKINGSANRLSNTTQDNLSFRNILQNMQVENKASSSSPTRISAGNTMDQIFEEAAEKYGVDANLLKAIGKAESNFNASAVSSAGAVGVMQLMPGTAKSLGVSDPYDARQNIMGGAKYISQLLDKYDGNVKLALAAYNAGPGNVDKYGGIPPFKETQNYVKRVTGYAGETISAGNQKIVSSENAGSSNGASQAWTGGSNDGITIETDTLMTLITLMRAQMELKLSSMMTAGVTDTDDTESNTLFSI